MAATARRRFGVVAKTALAAGGVWFYADQRGWVGGPWRHVHHKVPWRKHTLELLMRVKAAPPEIGQMDWPAGRVLLQWAVEGGVPLQGARVLEIGSGVGTTAIGLSLAAAARQWGAVGAVGGADGGADDGTQRCTSVVATDVCEACLDNLRMNAIHNGLRPIGYGYNKDYPPDDELSVLELFRWDAGEDRAVHTLPVELRNLTHVIGADVVYHGGASAEAGGSGGLARTLAGLLENNPALDVSLLLVDRFSGGAVAALAQQAGVPHEAADIDPAIARFVRACAESGLVATPVPGAWKEGVQRNVERGQTWGQWAAWQACGYWDGLILYKITRRPD